jgi:hypothetical protein
MMVGHPFQVNMVGHPSVDINFVIGMTLNVSGLELGDWVMSWSGKVEECQR